MAENANIAEQDGAPASPPSPQGDQFGDLSLEELADAVAQRVYRQEQSQADKAVAALRKELLPYLEEGKQTTSLVRRLAMGEVLSQDDLSGMDRQRAEALKVIALEEDNARLKAEHDALQKRGLNDEQLDTYLSVQTADSIVDFAREQGYITEKDDAAAWRILREKGMLPKERVASKGDDLGLRRFERESRAAIRKEMAAQLKDNDPPPAIPGGRASGPVQQDLSSFELMKRGMAARRGQ